MLSLVVDGVVLVSICFGGSTEERKWLSKWLMCLFLEHFLKDNALALMIFVSRRSDPHLSFVWLKATFRSAMTLPFFFLISSTKSSFFFSTLSAVLPLRCAVQDYAWGKVRTHHRHDLNLQILLMPLFFL